MKWFIKPLEEIADYRYMLENIKSKNTPVLATGVIDVQKTQLIYSLCEELDCGALIITDSETSAKEIHENMEFFDDGAVYLPAKDFIFILTVFNEHMEQELYAENICFILNKLMPVVYNAAVIGVTRESNDAIDKFKRNLIRKHCREFRPMEVLYELNLFYPFSLLLNWGIYRHHILYKYANLIKLYYKIWGRLYR